jgi:hypothetical protein
MKNKSRLVLLGLSLLLLSGCGYDGHFRYPCQDPANWEKAECKPPVCTASGTCPADLGVKQEGTSNG